MQSEKAPGSELEYEPAGGAAAGAATVTAGGAAAVTVTGAGVAAGWTDALPEALPTAIRATAPTTAPAIHSHLRLFFLGAGATGGAAKSVLIMKPFCFGCCPSLVAQC